MDNRCHSILPGNESSESVWGLRIFGEYPSKNRFGTCVLAVSIRIWNVFDRSPFRSMSKAFRNFSKYLAFFAVSVFFPACFQQASASSSGSVSSSGSAFLTGASAVLPISTGSLSPSPFLVQTGLRAEHNLPEEILGIEARYPGIKVSTVSVIYDEYGTGTDAEFRRTVALL